MRLGITGSSGFIGWHLRCLLRERPDLEVITANEKEFSSDELMGTFVSDCDAIIHLAGMNRGSEEDVYNVNVWLARALVGACEERKAAPRIIFANSIQFERENAYGRSKKEAWDTIAQWAEKAGAHCVNVILPNVFGEHGRPFYNSVVATFCFQLADGQKPEIIEDRVIPLIHVRDVAELLLEAAEGGKGGEMRPQGKEVTVSELLNLLRQIDAEYRKGVLPDLSDVFVRKLFNAYRSFLFPSFYPVYPKVNEDERGSLFETVVARSGGQSFMSTTKPGIIRGNHYHVNKFERFLVVRGNALIRLRRVLTDQVYEFKLGGDIPGYVDIPTLHTHNIMNIGEEELITLFWADEIFDPQAPDTFSEQV